MKVSIQIRTNNYGSGSWRPKSSRTLERTIGQVNVRWNKEGVQSCTVIKHETDWCGDLMIIWQVLSSSLVKSGRRTTSPRISIVSSRPRLSTLEAYGRVSLKYRNYQCRGSGSGSISQRYGSGPAPDPSLWADWNKIPKNFDTKFEQKI
jgi:hypothetical protein